MVNLQQFMIHVNIVIIIVKLVFLNHQYVHHVQRGKYLDFDFTCNSCDNSCVLCNSPSSNNCISCNSGYYISSNTCLKCSSNCLTCSGSASTCTSCNPGDVLSSNTCGPRVVEDSDFNSPGKGTTWSLYQYGCIRWNSDDFAPNTIGTLYVQYGPGFLSQKQIATDVNLSDGQYQWRITNINPGIVRIKFSARNAQSLYSDSFRVSPPNPSLNNEC